MCSSDLVVLPHFGHRRLDSIFLTPFGIAPDRTCWEWSRTVGHLGAADQYAGLDHLVGTGRAAPGDRCVLISVGAGYSWGAAVLEILERPAWAAPEPLDGPFDGPSGGPSNGPSGGPPAGPSPNQGRATTPGGRGGTS